MRPVICHLTLAVSLAFVGLHAAHAGERTYRWVDEKGRVHYSDVKSEKGQQVEVKPGSGVSETPKDSPATLAARQLDCQRKKDQVSIYNTSAAINETDSLGNTRTYSAAERQTLIDRAQQQAQTACSLPGANQPLTANAPN